MVLELITYDAGDLLEGSSTTPTKRTWIIYIGRGSRAVEMAIIVTSMLNVLRMMGWKSPFYHFFKQHEFDAK